jgi:hypothetical protein
MPPVPCYAAGQDAYATDTSGDAPATSSSIRPTARVSLCTGITIESHGRYERFQLAEVAVSRQMCKDILMLIARLQAPPAPA